MDLIDISPGDGSAMFDLNLFIIVSHFRATLYRHVGPAQCRDPSLDGPPTKLKVKVGGPGRGGTGGGGRPRRRRRGTRGPSAGRRRRRRAASPPCRAAPRSAASRPRRARRRRGGRGERPCRAATRRRATSRGARGPPAPRPGRPAARPRPKSLRGRWAPGARRGPGGVLERGRGERQAARSKAAMASSQLMRLSSGSHVSPDASRPAQRTRTCGRP